MISSGFSIISSNYHSSWRQTASLTSEESAGNRSKFEPKALQLQTAARLLPTLCQKRRFGSRSSDDPLKGIVGVRDAAMNRLQCHAYFLPNASQSAHTPLKPGG